MHSLVESLKKLEGSVRNAQGQHIVYKDSLGYPTLGYGHLLSRGIPEEVAEVLLIADIRVAIGDAMELFPEWPCIEEGRQQAIVELLFQLGRNKFLKFQKMIAAIRAGAWTRVLAELHNSKLWTQIGDERKAHLDELLGVEI